MIREGDEEAPVKSRIFVVPYAFSTESLGFGAGLAATYDPKSETLW